MLYEVITFSMLRSNKAGDQKVIALSNFTPVPRDQYRVGVPEAGTYQVVSYNFV